MQRVLGLWCVPGALPMICAFADVLHHPHRQKPITDFFSSTRCSSNDSGHSKIYSTIDCRGYEYEQHLLNSHPPASLFRGTLDLVEIKPMRTIVFNRCNDNFVTMRSRQQCPVGSKGYYEILLIKSITYPQWGFASACFARYCGFSDQGVGDDEHSWAIDGHRKLQCHNGIAGIWEGSWKEGDVIGLACDLTQETMQMLVSVNGNFKPPCGLVFNLDPKLVGSGLFAAFSGLSSDEWKGEMQYNLGETPFQHKAPSKDYKSFVEF